MGANAAELQALVQRLMERFDNLDMAAIEGMMGEDVQGVDEISRSWLRGRHNVKAYMAQLEEMGVSDVKSTTSDVHASSWGDTGLVTLMLDQTYSAGGEHVHIVAPMTVVFRREGGHWMIVLVSAVPLPETA